ncbi:class I SAM-dependent methyltransferase [Ornithobacterium rhinotracheale]|uniref:class I SAM-dependent methyltransferase n=1 Tax=Ornithobacterium rhinotracheale TaxID=28251 RepID=UPI001FF6A44C|nr:class I SAM-dependent methyltransferase [Ornithobacterium rhinotracheale]MCK0204326.1 methyltransferase domain-containing protein [Ornithobacterium rhinotracheale]
MLNTLAKKTLNLVPRPWLIRLSYLARPVLSVLYKGTKFQDPIDGKKYRKLLPYGYHTTRENALAPGSLSLERHRLMWLYLQHETKFFKQENLKVLHIAPEQCFYSRFKKQKNLEYTTLDLESPIADIKADICNMPLPDNHFDVVFCNHVLEHIPNDQKAMQELFRVMKPGGWGIFQVPMKPGLAKTYEDFNITSPEERQKHFGQYDHVRWYGDDYFDRLKKAGFKIINQEFVLKFTPDEIKYFALAPQELLPVVYKPARD